MAIELAYVIVTPYNIRKSRTGAILGRLLGRASADLVATQVFAPTREVAEAYAASIPPGITPDEDEHRELVRAYIREHFVPDANGRRHRILMLVFKGENAVHEVAKVVGNLRISNTTGETIRDTFGDLVHNPDGSVRYYEPAVLIAHSPNVVAELKPWLDFARTEPPIVDLVCVYCDPARVEETLVLIKPDSWRQRSSRPGAIVDMFSRTGLRVIACTLCRMSVEQAMAFYDPVRDMLCRKLAPGIGVRAREMLARELKCPLPAETEAVLAEHVGVPYARDQFERIIEFMTGTRPSACPPGMHAASGKVRCLALVYQGEDAVAKIRDVLGPTDPTQAPDGTVRREFGLDVMVNTAHASDSHANAKREMSILRINEPVFADDVARALADCRPAGG